MCESHYQSQYRKRKKYGYDALIALVDKRTGGIGALMIGNHMWNVDDAMCLLRQGVDSATLEKCRRIELLRQLDALPDDPAAFWPLAAKALGHAK